MRLACPSPMKTLPSTVASAPRHRNRSRLLNVWVDNLSMAELVANLNQGTVYTLNLDHCYLLQRNREFLEAYQQADFVTSDSNYVFLALRMLGRGVEEKLSGSDIVPAFYRHHAGNPAVTMFLLGAGPGVAARARDRINAKVGREMVVGAHGPSMRFVDDSAEIDEAIAMINASGATALIVGLGAPKQEIWIKRYRDRMPNVRVFMGVGATLDYEAGTVARAPSWMSHAGLEWMYRVVTEPKRYWRRYVRDLEFFWLVILDWLGYYRPPAMPSSTPTPG